MFDMGAKECYDYCVVEEINNLYYFFGGIIHEQRYS